MSLINKVVQFMSDALVVHMVAHGGPTETVTTEGGEIRSLAKLVADCETSFNAATSGTLALATAKANAASDSAAAASASAATAVEAAGSVGLDCLYVREEQLAGIAGGTAQGDAEYKRTLNTVVKNSIAGAGLGNNEVVLPAGRYHIYAFAPASRGANQSKIVSTAGDSVELIGSAFSGSIGINNVFAGSTVRGEVTLTQPTTLKLVTRHGTVGGTPNGNDLGAPASKYKEIYSEIEIWKLP